MKIYPNEFMELGREGGKAGPPVRSRGDPCQ